MTFVFIFHAALYIAIPVLAILISGRQVTWRGWVLFVLLWPVFWMFGKPEELP